MFSHSRLGYDYELFSEMSGDCSGQRRHSVTPLLRGSTRTPILPGFGPRNPLNAQYSSLGGTNKPWCFYPRSFGHSIIQQRVYFKRFIWFKIL